MESKLSATVCLLRWRKVWADGSNKNRTQGRRPGAKMGVKGGKFCSETEMTGENRRTVELAGKGIIILRLGSAGT